MHRNTSRKKNIHSDVTRTFLRSGSVRIQFILLTYSAALQLRSILQVQRLSGESESVFKIRLVIIRSDWVRTINRSLHEHRL